MKTLPLLCRRAAAFLYDSLLLVAVFFLVTGIAVYLNDTRPVGGPLYLALLWVVAGAFLVLFWSNGRTLGMQAWRLRIVDDRARATPSPPGSDRRGAVDGDALGPVPGPGQLIARYALGSALFGVSWLWMPFDRDGLALHDRLSRTRIVRGRG